MKLKSFLCLILANLWLTTTVQGGDLPETGEQDFTRFTGPYLGLAPPGSGTEVFLPNLVSTSLEERCVTFLDSGRVLLFTTDDGGTHYTWLNGEHWVPAQPFPFNYRDDMIDYTAGPDDKSLVFMTSRPVDEDDTSDSHHPWTVEWSGSEWGQPVPLPTPNKTSGLGSGYPTLTSDGSLFFISDARDGSTEGGIFLTHRSKGSTGKAELLPPPVNTEHIEFDPYVAPDGRYLIFTSNRPGGIGKYDNYIVFREKDGGWSPAFNLGEGLNTEHSECCPNVTADGKLFFFVSRRPSKFLTDDAGQALPTGRDVYWAGTDWIEKLTEQHRESKNTSSTFPTLTGPYLGQQPPGLEPEIFAPGIISTAEPEGCAVFSIDGKSLVFTRFVGEQTQRANFVMHEEHGQWSTLRALPFATEFPIADFTYSPDGKYLLFTSRQPLDASMEKNEKRGLWSVEKTGTGWAEPVHFGDVINQRDALYPSMTLDGSLYFMDWHYPPDEERSTDIYVSRLVNGEYTEPERVSDKINSKYHDFDPFVAPDESYMIFCSIRPGDLGNGDLYISFRNENGFWGEAVHMGPKFNTTAGENRPFVTLDGKYFFFTSNKDVILELGEAVAPQNTPGNGSRDVYWVDAKVIEQFRPKPD